MCDHRALTYIHTQKHANNSMMLNWFDYIQDFNFDVVYLPGVDNVLADRLNRFFSPMDHNMGEDALDKNNKIIYKRKNIKFKKEKLRDQFDLSVSVITIWRTIVKNIGFTIKRTKPVEEKRNDPTTLQKRRDFILKLAKDGIAYDKNCIFDNEAGFNANFIRGEGWSKIGEEGTVTTRSERALNLSILAAILYQGVERVYAKIVRGGTTGSIFATLIQNIIDTLDKSNAPVQYFIMDNASIHGTPEVKRVFNNSRHKYVFLPPYSPFLNAIEECFSKDKTLVKRKRGLKKDELALYIGGRSERVTDSDCEG
ncbi:hypothetical protein [Parasitella parasitica]|uniref:Tc1-like transposase DDE domain-containing protein n=1 Tax=Parasitella parasitica TaxID=35722 RepID=A0A0B7NIY7_9FUNG|nr:hypothetical protein [Parasitella parasitica]